MSRSWGKGQGRWPPIAAAALVSVLLMGAAWFLRSGVRDASLLVARGMGEAFATAGWEALGGTHYPPDQEALQRFLEQHQAEGLRYVGLVGQDGQITTRAGEARGRELKEGVQLLEGRARQVGRLRPPRPPPGTPRPPPPENLAEARRRLPRVVYEFEPLTALQLQRAARNLLIVAAVFCVGILGLAFALSRSLGQREKLREELEHGRRLAALGSMSAVLAHELRNPLASLKGHAQLLAESVEGDGRLQPKADRVVSEAVRLERLMNDLLVFVKSGELQRERVDAASVLRAAVSATGAPAIEAQYPAQPEPASLDAERLQQALENVLRNAVQASPEGAPVRAEVSRVDGRVVFTVRDQGPGIPPGEEARIFEPFVTGRTRGVGLGLAITRRIVELHGGTIAARNLDGGGAEFRIEIPAKEA